jgi:hypothetical protein
MDIHNQWEDIHIHKWVTHRRKVVIHKWGIHNQWEDIRIPVIHKQANKDILDPKRINNKRIFLLFR